MTDERPFGPSPDPTPIHIAAAQVWASLTWPLLRRATLARLPKTPRQGVTWGLHGLNIAVLSAFLWVGLTGPDTGRPLLAAMAAPAPVPAPLLAQAPVLPALDRVPHASPQAPDLFIPASAPLVVTSLRPAHRPDVLCLALNIHHEARGEPLHGQVMVAHVTLNRTAAGYKGAGSICDTVFAHKQFSWTWDPTVVPPTAEELAPSLELAYAVLAGRTRDRTQGAMHYYNPGEVDAYWQHAYVEVAVVGNHRFMR